MTAPSPAASPPTLSIVAPTYREAANVPVLFEKLKVACDGLPWEMIVVDDDSSDGTSDVAAAIAKRDPRMRVIRRVDRNGLAGAVIEGWLSSSADYIAVIDADLQHDERILPQMYAALREGRADMAIGTRIDDASAPKAFSPARQMLSDLGAKFFRGVAGVGVSDPMSGFFMLRRELIGPIAAKLSPDGFKILVDVLMLLGTRLKIVETPYVFRARVAGESKLSMLVGVDFLGLIAHHASRGFLPTRFVLFAGVGAFGVIVNLAALAVLLAFLGPEKFGLAQSAATLAAMASNFLLNNEITYRPRRYRGWGKIGGFLLFVAVCGIGVVANVNVAVTLFAAQGVWWLAGVAGALVGVVWNYAVSSAFVWRRRRS